MSEHPFVINPEAIGDPDQTPVVQVQTDDDCPMHSEDWMYRAVRNNRRNAGYPPQACTCETPAETTEIEQVEDAFCADCETLMVPTDVGHQCPVHDWHDECSLDECGTDEGKSCGLREAFEPGNTPAETTGGAR